MFLLAVGLMCLTACAQKKGGERGPHMGGGMSVNKDSDSTFVALKNETLKKFRQLTFEDAKTGQTMAYNLLVPEGYDGTKSYPLVLFMADASTVGKDVTAPLTQGYGALEFASDRDQKEHPSFVLVPQYTEWAVQDDWSTTCRYQPTIHHRPVDGRHDVVLLQHHAPRPLCCLIVRQQSVGHLENAGLRQEEVFLHRGWWRPESIGRDARFGKGIEGEQRKG